MSEAGWCRTLVPYYLLKYLNIPNDPVGVDTRRPGAQVFAPAWVYAIWFLQAECKVDWQTLIPLLSKVVNDKEEQRMLCADLALHGKVPATVRRAARNYEAVLSGGTLEKVDFHYDLGSEDR